MDFSLLDIDNATQAFWDDVRTFLDEHLTDEVLEEEWRTGAGHNVGFHLRWGRRGWVIPTWPADEGGAGLSARRRRSSSGNSSRAMHPRSQGTPRRACSRQWSSGATRNSRRR